MRQMFRLVVDWHDPMDVHGLEWCVVRAAQRISDGSLRVRIDGLWEAERDGDGWRWRYRDDEWRPLTPEHLSDMDEYGRLPVVMDDDLNLELIPIGGRIPVRSQIWTLRSRTPKTWTFDVDGRQKRVSIESETWFRFVADVRAAYVASRHGVDGGCLSVIWPPQIPGGALRGLTVVSGEVTHA